MDRGAIEAAFTRADTNKDGKLSKEEAAKLPAIAAKFEQLDKDKDGALSLEEFGLGYSAVN
jgi:Ca2+-binding EF-hand superfamily protein